MHIMKMITAVVRPFKLDELRQAIAQLGVQGVTVTEVYEAQFGPRAKVEIAVDGCLECGTCRVVCAETGEVEWNYPRGGYGVLFKFG